MYNHRRDVLRFYFGTRWNLHPELGEHVFQAVHGEGRIGVFIPRTIQPHHKAIANELVAAHALDRSEVLDTFRSHRKRQLPYEKDEQQQAGQFLQLIYLHHHVPQNGNNTLLKKRASQPMALASATMPSPT